MNTSRLKHRGASGNAATFAPAFVRGRLDGFKKDIQICLTGIPSMVRTGLTHAYFPALAACCATLEYLTALYLGKAGNSLGHKEIAKYAGAFMPTYDAETIRVLFDAFRNAVAHRGIASGVWIDPHPMAAGRRLTWKVYALEDGPAIAVVAEGGKLTKDSPWDCHYTHRVHIRLQRLAIDICASAERYLAALGADHTLQRQFMKCMEALYPR